MVRRLILVLCLVAGCWLPVGCGSSPPPQAETMSYVDRSNHFAINPFPSWERQDPKRPRRGKNIVAEFVCALPEGAGQAVVNVAVDTAAGMTDYEQYLRSNRDLFNRQAVGYDELRAAVVDHPNGRKVCLIEATYERILDGKNDVEAAGAPRPKLRFVQYALLNEGKQFIITATGPATDAEALWLNEATAILDSLVIW